MPLSESRLAKQLRTSRTPVREALSRLAEEGYVERIPRRGYSVTPVSIGLIRNVFEVRRVLEGEAAARAAELADAAFLEHLRNVTTFEYRRGDPTTFRQATQANADFHMSLARLSENTLLAELVGRCLEQFTRLVAIGLEYEPFQDSGSAEHQEVVEAIARRAPDEARRAMERHLDGSRRRLMDALVRGEVRAVQLAP